MKQKYQVGLHFTGSGINDENHSKETGVGLRGKHLKLRRLGRLREGRGGAGQV